MHINAGFFLISIWVAIDPHPHPLWLDVCEHHRFDELPT